MLLPTMFLAIVGGISLLGCSSLIISARFVKIHEEGEGAVTANNYVISDSALRRKAWRRYSLGTSSPTKIFFPFDDKDAMNGNNAENAMMQGSISPEKFANFHESLLPRFPMWILASLLLCLYVTPADADNVQLVDQSVSVFPTEELPTGITANQGISDQSVAPAALSVAYLKSNIAASTSSTKVIDVNWRYFLSGAVCCSFSHGVSVPCEYVHVTYKFFINYLITVVNLVDVVKTRIQSQAREVGEATEGVRTIVSRIIKEEGASALLRGMSPTLVGFAVQGSLKYGFYDVFKQVVNNELAVLNWHWEKLFVFMLAGAAAEIIGTTRCLINISVIVLHCPLLILWALQPQSLRDGSYSNGL